MKINRIDPAVPLPSAARSVRGVAAEEPGPAALAQRVGAALSSPDPAGALRVLVEEIRTELQARLGPSTPLPAPGTDRLDEDTAVAVLLRYLRATSRGAAGSGALTPEALREAVEAGVARARTVLAATARVPEAVRAAVEQVIGRVRSATDALAPRPASALADGELAKALVREVAATLSERIGMLPAKVTASPPQGPREALARLSTLFREVSADSVLAVRASGRVLELAVRDGTQRALAALPPSARSDPALVRLAADLATLALRSAAGTLSPPPRNPPSALGLMAGEFRQVLGEWTAGPPSPQAAHVAVRDVPRALSALATAAAEALAKVPPAQVVALRAVLESAADTALRRSLLQLPSSSAEPALRATLEQLQLSFRSLLAAADSAATGRGLDPRGWIGLVARAGEALLEDGPLPFRFDLPATGPAASRRRGLHGGRGESIEAIESSEPDEEGAREDEPPPGPPLWPRMPAG